MAKHKDIYIGKGFYSFGTKDMEKRGVAIESVVYPKIERGTKIHGYENNCTIEQNGNVLCCREPGKMASWSEEIEKLAPNIKASFFGLGAYKNVTVTGLNTKGVESSLSLSAKSSNGVTCNLNCTASVFLRKVDIKKFRAWMKEWGSKFDLHKNGDVWLTMTEWHKFVMRVLIPFTYETIMKKKAVPASSMPIAYSGRNSICEDIKETLKSYLLNNAGITVTVFFN